MQLILADACAQAFSPSEGRSPQTILSFSNRTVLARVSPLVIVLGPWVDRIGDLNDLPFQVAFDHAEAAAG